MELQAKARADFDERGFARLLMLGALVVADPDVAVEHVEGQRVVYKGFASSVVARRAKRLLKHLLEQLQVRLGLEGRIKDQEGP